MEPQVVGALIAATVGFVIAGLQLVLGFLERRRTKRDENIFYALQYFDGGSQRRSIGIAIVEGYWTETPHLKTIYVPLLVNQAIYLISEAKQAAAKHEINNLDRIITLLEDVPKREPKFSPHYGRLLQVLEARKGTASDKGVQVAEEVIDDWIRRLQRAP